ncbi:hypothetical protein FW774_03540 (plasmid) [Pedobacter sp. BS3]|uniref:hypothetical protein n=1 Tax=Pedobacter sp. BS3 TaxID=2567937 RepID=UPI0011EC82A6|nr:hypothetical protein [Pedobacter sp. BS3]TZF86136.1 hypothetical protein FW774_03540 [Pedobacter sp. BS3]
MAIAGVLIKDQINHTRKAHATGVHQQEEAAPDKKKLRTTNLDLRNGEKQAQTTNYLITANNEQ